MCFCFFQALHFVMKPQETNINAQKEEIYRSKSHERWLATTDVILKKRLNKQKALQQRHNTVWREILSQSVVKATWNWITESNHVTSLVKFWCKDTQIPALDNPAALEEAFFSCLSIKKSGMFGVYICLILQETSHHFLRLKHFVKNCKQKIAI